MILSKEKLEGYIQELQKTLMLQDWTIEICLINQYETKDRMGANHYDHIGLCERFPNRREAVIYLNIDHSRISECWYETIIHEMLHIHTSVLDDIVLNVTEQGSFERNHFEFESETLNCTMEKIISRLCPKPQIEEGENDG